MISKLTDIQLLFQILFQNLQDSTDNMFFLLFIHLSLWLQQKRDQEELEHIYRHGFGPIEGKNNLYEHFLDVVDMG